MVLSIEREEPLLPIRCVLIFKVVSSETNAVKLSHQLESSSGHANTIFHFRLGVKKRTGRVIYRQNATHVHNSMSIIYLIIQIVANIIAVSFIINCHNYHTFIIDATSNKFELRVSKLVRLGVAQLRFCTKA